MSEPESEPRRVRSSSIGRMSQLLLQGWAMLADCCPECGVPLMRHPGNHQLLCVNCGDDSAAPAVEAGPPTGAAAAAGQGRAEAALERLPNGTAGSDSSGEEEGNGGGLVQAPPSLSTRLRQAMDLPSDDGSAGGAAVQASQAGGSATIASGGQARTGAAGSGSSGQAQGQAQHDASKEIAELMLEGWAMLQDHCPRCLNPLLRSRDRRIYCAGCQMFAVREGDVAMHQQQQRQQNAAAGGQQAGPEREPVATSSAAAALPAPPPLVAASTPAPAPTSAMARATAPVPYAAMQQHLPAVDAAAAAVAERLAAATAALLSQGAAGDAALLLNQLQQCAATIQALADCRRSLMGAS